MCPLQQIFLSETIACRLYGHGVKQEANSANGFNLYHPLSKHFMLI